MKTAHPRPEMHPLPHYLLTRCLLLTCMLLCAALAMLLLAGGYSLSSVPLYEYADQLQTSALMVFGAGLIGAPLLEDVLRKDT